MRPAYTDDRVTVHLGDCRDVLRDLPDASIDAIVTDPPYELGFMGRTWDSSGVAYDTTVWAECLRVLKPGGHLLAFGGTRTWHRLVVAVEDAGFEIRDSITWLYASGFPKSLDVSKAIDNAAGAEREVIGKRTGRAATPRTDMRGGNYGNPNTARNLDLSAITAPATDAARRWAGWGTALKPASEPVVVARKPLAGTVASNVLAYGTGALNIDGCRVGAAEKLVRPQIQRTDNDVLGKGLGVGVQVEPSGRWPANVVLTHAPECGPADAAPCVDGCPVADLDAQSGVAYGDFTGQAECTPARGADEGGASRFFPTFRYEPKAPTSERPRADGVAHPTVKPVDLMRWLVRHTTRRDRPRPVRRVRGHPRSRCHTRVPRCRNRTVRRIPATDQTATHETRRPRRAHRVPRRRPRPVRRPRRRGPHTVNHRLMATQHPAPQPARDRRSMPYTCEVCHTPVPAGIVDVTGRRRHHWHGTAPDPTDTPQATTERRWDLYNATTPRRKDTQR